MALPHKNIEHRPTRENFEALDRRRPVVGIVSGTGAIQAGGGFTVVKNGVGDYTVTFTTRFPGPPVVVVGSAQGAGGSGAKLFTGVLPSASSFRVTVFTTTTGAAVDAAFSFVAHPV